MAVLLTTDGSCSALSSLCPASSRNQIRLERMDDSMDDQMDISHCSDVSQHREDRVEVKSPSLPLWGRQIRDSRVLEPILLRRVTC